MVHSLKFRPKLNGMPCQHQSYYTMCPIIIIFLFLKKIKNLLFFFKKLKIKILGGCRNHPLAIWRWLVTLFGRLRPFSPSPLSALWVKVISVAVESYKSDKPWFTARVKKSRSKDDKVCFTTMAKGLQKSLFEFPTLFCGKGIL